MYEPSEQVIEWGKANGYNIHAHVETFNDYLANRTRKPYKDLDSAFRNCVRADWCGIRRQMTKDGTYWPKSAPKRVELPQPVTEDCTEARERAMAMFRQVASKMVVK